MRSLNSSAAESSSSSAVGNAGSGEEGGGEGWEGGQVHSQAGQTLTAGDAVTPPESCNTPEGGTRVAPPTRAWMHKRGSCAGGEMGEGNLNTVRCYCFPSSSEETRRIVPHLHRVISNKFPKGELPRFHGQGHLFWVSSLGSLNDVGQVTQIF